MISQAEVPAEDDLFRVNSAEGGDVLFNMERLVFSDGNMAIDIDGVGGEAYRIYQAAFDRTPDEDGVGYWIAQMDRGMEVTEVASRFIDSDEFGSQYGEAPSTEQFLSALYSNVLDREPDNEGFAWWLGQLDNNPEKTPDKVLADFSESPENQTTVLILSTMVLRIPIGIRLRCSNYGWEVEGVKYGNAKMRGDPVYLYDTLLDLIPWFLEDCPAQHVLQ